MRAFGKVSWTAPHTLLLQHRILFLQIVDVLLVSVVFPPHELDVLGGFVQNLCSGSLKIQTSRVCSRFPVFRDAALIRLHQVAPIDYNHSLSRWGGQTAAATSA